MCVKEMMEALIKCSIKIERLFFSELWVNYGGVSGVVNAAPDAGEINHCSVTNTAIQWE